MSLLINIEDLLSGAIIEGSRMEFKKGWNPTTTMRTICAFANDFENEGSGYIIVGVSEENGKPVRPVIGFDPNDYEMVQKDMIGYCNLIQPTYYPNLSLEEVDGKHVLAIWVSAGTNRPYKVPDDVLSKHKTYNYRIRQYSSTIIPNPEQESELIQLTAKIPFDDRVNQQAKIGDLNFSLMREHLEKTKSKLFNESARMSVEELAHQMNLCQGANEHLFPKNVGLLMFSTDPQKYFKGAQIDLVEFPEGVAGKKFTEKVFKGTIQQELIDVLSYIKSNIIKEKITKFSDRAEADRVFNYPFEAIEEALANAVYHRNYELLDSIEVRILPSSIEIISFNGVDPSLKQLDFDKGIVRARRYRNRRVGEFLKDLKLTEGKGTGIPTIIKALEENGSPKPIFDANEPERTFFISEFHMHESFSELKEREKNIEVSDLVIKVLNYCKTPRSRLEILSFMELSNQTKNFNTHILPLLEQNWIEHTIKENLKDRNQKYLTTDLGNAMVNDL